MKTMTRQLLVLGLPLAIGFISQMLISFTDAALIARVGAVELAGTTLALSLFSLVMLMGLGVITAVSPRVAEAFERSDGDAVRKWFSQGTWLALAAGLVGVLLLQFTGPILRLIGQSAEVASVAQEYNQGASAGLVFFLLYVNSRSVMGAVGRPKPLTVIMLLAVPVNFLVGWAFIFGTPFTAAAGVLGAGLSSTVVRLLIVIAAYAVLLRARAFRDLKLSESSRRPDLVALRNLSGLGLPIGVRILLGEGFLPVIAFFVAQYGADATAAHAVGLRVESLVGVFALGFSSAATTLAAWSRSARDWRRLQHLQWSLFIVAAGYALGVSALIALLFPQIQTQVFGLSSVTVSSLLWSLLPWVLLSFCFDSVGSMYNGFLVGMLDTKLPTLVVAISYWAFGLGLGMILAWAGAGFFGLWIGMTAAGFVVTVFNVYRASVHVRRLRRVSGELVTTGPGASGETAA
ncbi:MATE family efflux transporter [Curtobacterium sp. PhB136]|uniref:MATE family efflux transporter n=1 Tax=Curtobacterium sp. PhB136 TaxID=2485181 RepID=UPI0010512D08|nr:MATE family efflux transporter [Curtobacterium sp. PhB136]TCK65753.1 MATE family multidrug resistance protein [Curtobacterium sp. PhB136]